MGQVDHIMPKKTCNDCFGPQVEKAGKSIWLSAEKSLGAALEWSNRII